MYFRKDCASCCCCSCGGGVVVELLVAFRVHIQFRLGVMVVASSRCSISFIGLFSCCRCCCGEGGIVLLLVVFWCARRCLGMVVCLEEQHEHTAIR